MSDIETAIKFIQKEHDEFKSRLQDEINVIKIDIRTNEKSLYSYIDENNREIRREMVQEITELMKSITEDIIQPFKEFKKSIEDIKKRALRYFAMATGIIFSGMIAFIAWLMSVTSAMGNIEKLLGG